MSDDLQLMMSESGSESLDTFQDLGESDDCHDMSMDEHEHPRKRLKSKDDKLCGVCGDRALGYNFNAITCESCKAFFRRNALKKKKMKCLFRGNCIIDVRTRRFCPCCRLQKCLDIGMKENMILGEHEKRLRMAKVTENRMKREERGKVMIKEEPLDYDMQPMADSSNACSSSVMDSQSSNAPSPADLFEHIPESMMPTDPTSYRQLTPEEHELLEEITIAYRETVGSSLPKNDPKQDESHFNTVSSWVNNSEFAVRRLIKFVKKMADFCRINQEDQIASLKSSVVNTLLLRSVAFYIVERDSWMTPNGEISTKVLKTTTRHGDLYDSHIKYCRSLKSIVNNNTKLFALIQTLIIFNPDAQNIRARDEMSNVQDKYLILLKHYLEHEYSFEFAKNYFVAILAKIYEIKKISDNHAKVLLQVDPAEIEPIMLEILNLK
ncbi:nuclear hormone receptor HR96 isoform X1 [Patella vulgata]|uniref:nuclear hormone receptor HR96 isoform X1 n=2 Tax=Patella vulgata TaxID=6465 RepID=UPI00217FC949|nr:nuclear hormone receptor HR96 isoform X1 [Patella vulgata]